MAKGVVSVILLKARRGLGPVGSLVSVAPGYARNFLIPTGSALLATKDNLVIFEKHRDEALRENQLKLAESKQLAEKFVGRSVVIIRPSGGDGRLFGSVTTKQIAASLAEQGISIDPQSIVLKEGGIKSIGCYNVDVVLHADIVAHFKVIVARSLIEAEPFIRGHENHHTEHIEE